MASFKAKLLLRPLMICTLLLAFAAISPLGIALGQIAPGSSIVSDVPLAGGIERVLLGVPRPQDPYPCVADPSLYSFIQSDHTDSKLRTSLNP
jgi:hypothetical protein